MTGPRPDAACGAGSRGAGTSRSLRPVTGEVFDQIFLDGKHIGYGWVLLSATNQDGQVIAWQWATSENSTAYKALLEHVAPPVVVTVDGAKGGLSAVRDLWENEGTKVQRCLIHINRNNTDDLTLRPKTNAGIALKALSKRLLKINSLEQAAQWEQLLHDFHNQYGQYLKERTHAADNPQLARALGKKWWYTHDRDRRVYFCLARLARQGTLFTYLDAIEGKTLHKTTNIAESLNGSAAWFETSSLECRWGAREGCCYAYALSERVP